MREVEEEEQNNCEYDELSVGGTKITELRYADDTALFSTTLRSKAKTASMHLKKVTQNTLSVTMNSYLLHIEILMISTNANEIV